MGKSKYLNSQAVDEALDKGVSGYDSTVILNADMVQVKQDIEELKQASGGNINSSVYFEALADMAIYDTEFGALNKDENTIIAYGSIFTTEDAATWSSYGKSAKTIELLNGYKKIPASFFANITNMETFVVPTSVTVLESDCFKGCSNLTNIEFTPGSRLTTLESGVFDTCTSLQKLDLRNCDDLQYIKSGFANASNTALTEINLGKLNYTTGIDQGVFASIATLQKLTVEYVKQTQTSVFSGLNATELIIDKVDFIANPIAGNNKLVTIHIDEAVTINGGAFSGNPALQNLEIVKIGTLGSGALASVTTIKDIHFQEVNSVQPSSFYGMSLLETVTIDKCNEIATNVFMQCPKLKEIHIPHTTTINSGAFTGVSGIKIYVNSDVATASSAPWGATDSEVIWTD